MGRDALSCRHDFQPIYEDHILMGSIYYYDECRRCKQKRNTEPGPLALGTYR
jgi:hypothetical protein